MINDKHSAAAVAVNPPADAESLAYTTNPAAPGLKFFLCATFRAVLSQKGCGSRWREAQSATGREAERYAACRGCPIGAAHAGEQHVRYSRWYKVQVCPRCHKGGMRMIGNRLCVSCYNRDRELKVGRNGRGNKPVELMARAPRMYQVTVKIDDETFVYSAPSVSTQELVLQTLRTARGEISFSRVPGGIHLRDGSVVTMEERKPRMDAENDEDPGRDDREGDKSITPLDHA